MVKILSLDDDCSIGDLMSLILERVGYGLLTTGDSYEAWALLHTVPVDLLIQDTMRPYINGHDFLRLMRADEHLRDIPVLMVTAFTQEKHRALALNAGAAGYITKPFAVAELVAAVREVLLGRGKPVPPEMEWHVMSPEQCRTVVHDADSQVRRAALLAWGWATDEWPVEPPIQALADPDGAVRLVAVRALQRLKDPRAVRPLVAVLDDEQIEVRLAAIQALGALEDARAAGPLAERLSGADAATRWAAALALGRLKATQATEPLLAALNDDNSLVRMMAALSLGRIKDHWIVATLTKALADDDVWVRHAAAVALGRGGDPRAVESLLQAQ